MAGSFVTGSNPLTNEVSLFLLQVISIVVVSKLISIPLRKLHQPVVIAEVIGGILLGPSAFGKIPGFSDSLFPKESLGSLKLISQFGLVFYLFLVGMELDAGKIKDQFKLSAAISLAGIALPFGVGIGISKYIYDTMADQSKVSFTTFLIFCGVSLSITAFPVLARILSERKLLPTKVGQATLAAAAVDDAIAWVLLGLVVALIKNPDSAISALYVFLITIGYTVFLWVVVRPQLIRLVDLAHRQESHENTAVIVTLVLVLASAFFTEAAGIDAIFGGFLVGTITPHEHGFSIRMTEKIEDLVTSLLLPLYFAYSGLNTRIDMLNSWFYVFMVFVVTTAAVFGKVVGCTLSAKAVGNTWRESFAIGFLMSTKGLVELIVLNLGLKAGVITPEIFTVFVLMALLTTFMTVPIITVVYPYSLYLGETADDLKSIIGTQADDDSRDKLHLLVCLPSVNVVPGTMALTQLLAGNGNISVVALRLIELSDRMSSVMRGKEPSETLRTDGAVSMFRTFGQLNHRATVSSMVSVSDRDGFHDIINSATLDLHTGMVLFPVYNRNQTLNGKLYPVAQRLFDTVKCSVGVLVDRGFGAIGEPLELFKETEEVATINDGSYLSTVVYLYNGSEDDSELLYYIKRVSAGVNVSITILDLRVETDKEPIFGDLENVSVIKCDLPLSGDMILPSPGKLRSHLVVVGKSLYEDSTVVVGGSEGVVGVGEFLGASGASYFVVRGPVVGGKVVEV